MLILRPSTRRLAASVAIAALASLVMVTASSAAASAAGNGPSQWTMFGQNLNNTASISATSLSTSNVSALKPKWVFTTGGDVSARAAVAQGVAYFPDWSGHLYAVKSGSGKLVWSTDIASYTGATAGTVVSRTSPFLDTKSNTLYIGTQTGAYLLAINADTGALKWRTQLDSHALAVDTQSPVVYNGSVYVGVASLEEGAAADPAYPCCSFRGSVMKLDATTGAVQWKTYMVPQGYTGGSVWGSTIVPDPARGVVYATTGNNYTASGDSPDNHVDSVVALDMATGALTWADRFASADDWTVACFSGPTAINCPVNAGPDFDFGSGVQLFTIQTPSGPSTILGAGQKSGVYSAIDPSTGAVRWATQVGPGSALGGIEWGSATDGNRIYVAIGNLYGIPYPNSALGTAGSWAALDPATGQIIWQKADPNGSIDLGPVTVANGVVYAPSMAGGTANNNMYALNAATGGTLWSFAAGGSVIAGASIANDTVYWGSGYGHLGGAFSQFTGNNKFYAFTLNGK
jgi:polyvinyl alcohol dehydrogenase (cytochrome)